MEMSAKQRNLFASTLIFIYIVIGYLTIVYFLDPKMFILDLPNQWWIIPFAFFIALMRLVFSRFEIFKEKDKNHE